MKRALVILALCASVAWPVAVCAQPAPPPPSPELRSMMEKIHAEAKTAAFAAVTPAHAASVTAIVAQVAAGTLDPRSAGKQIDGLLTTDESKAVLAAEFKTRANMRAAMDAAGIGGPPPGRGGPGAPPPGMGAPDGPPPDQGGPDGHRFRPSPGRYLMMVSMTPEQMQKLRPHARSSAAP